MGDFGKILDEWESLRNGSHREDRPSDRSSASETADHDPDRSEWFARQIDRYPVVDKDARPDGERAPGGVRADRLAPQDSIDLHGYTVDDAVSATERFIRASVARGLRKVVVIHGKGRNGEGVLKRAIRAYLERHPDTGAMGYSRGQDGGRGALWVVLRVRGK